MNARLIDGARSAARLGLAIACTTALLACGGGGGGDAPPPQVTMSIQYGSNTALSGNIVMELAPAQTPRTVDNFLAYVNAGFYNGTIFHRVDPELIQGGGFVPGSSVEKTPIRPPIELEVGRGLSNVQWSVAMAQAANNPNSATSQFYVNTVDNSAFLDPGAGSAGYAVFGTVIAGRDLLARIAADPCLTNPACLPPADVVITSAVQTR